MVMVLIVIVMVVVKVNKQAVNLCGMSLNIKGCPSLPYQCSMLTLP